MERNINTTATLKSSLQRPTTSNRGVPVSFVDMTTEPEYNPDAPPHMPDMPDHPPPYLDPAPDEPNEDMDDRPGDDLECTIREIEGALVQLQAGYMALHKLREKLRSR